MSDLSLQLQQATGQLPVTSYFDEALYKREMSVLFKQGPQYIGHELSVPEIGDYATLPQENHGRVLINTPNGIELVSNVCRHRQALMLQGRGSLNQLQPGSAAGNLVCPLHRWTYSGGHKEPLGTLLGAPHFPSDPCLNLQSYPLQKWNGLLFEKNDCPVSTDLASMGPIKDLNFSGFVLNKVEMHNCNYNWKTFIEVYLEDYHVGPFHPGLGGFVSCDDLKWEFKDNYSIQTVGASSLSGQAGTPIYQTWQDQLNKYNAGKIPNQGAIWLTYYPHIMVEWYPHVLTVSTLHPMGPDKTLNMVSFLLP